MVLVWCALAVGCTRAPETSWDDPGPEATFERFLMHWFKNEQGAAYEMIHPDDRAALTESLSYVEERLGSEVLAPREMLVAGRVDNPYDLEDIESDPELEREPEEGTSVRLELIYHDGRSGEATVIWGGDQWYVDLPLEVEAGAGEEEPKREPASATPDATSGDSRE